MSFVHVILSGKSRLSGFLLGALLSGITVTANAATEASVLAVERGADGSLWVVSPDRLQRLEGQDSKTFALPEEARDSTSLSLAVSADNALYLAGGAFGVYQSEDAGESWSKTISGLPSDSIKAVAAHATLDNIVYAYSTGHGMYRSADGGESWARIDAGPQEPVQAFLHSSMPGSMETGWLFAGTERGVARSMDCFCFWGDAGDLRGEVTALAYDAKSPMNVYASTGASLHHSADGGESWVSLSAPAAVIDLAVSDGQLYAGTEEGLFVLQGDQWEEAVE